MSLGHPLLGPEARIYGLLVQVVEIAERNNWGTRNDVLRVADQYLRPPSQQYTNHELRARAHTLRQQLTAAHEELETLRALHQWQSPDGKVRRVVELTRRQAQALTEICAGATASELAEHFGFARKSANNLIGEVVRAIGATDRAHAVELVQSNQVVICVRGSGERTA